MHNIMELKKRNEEIAKKFNDMEDRLSASQDPLGLFEAWMTGMSEFFGIPFLWISIIAEPENASLINVLKSSSALKDHVNIIDKDTFMSLVPKGIQPVLVNIDLRSYFRLLPKNKYFVKSMAIAPITINDRVLGSLNHGDASSTRYEPDMDTSLLASLAAKVSSCLLTMTKGDHVPPLSQEI